MAVAEVRSWVLDQQPPAEFSLRLIHMPAEDLEALSGVGERHQVVEVDPADRTPRQVLGNQHRLDTLDQCLEAAEVNAVEVLGAAQRQSHAMKANRVIAAQLEESVEGNGLGHIIFGMHLEKAEFGSRRRNLGDMGRAQADARAAVRDHGHKHVPRRLLSLF